MWANLVWYSEELFQGSMIIIFGLILLRLILALMREHHSQKYRFNNFNERKHK